jgi:hypothetical protein
VRIKPIATDADDGLPGLGSLEPGDESLQLPQIRRATTTATCEKRELDAIVAAAIADPDSPKSLQSAGLSPVSPMAFAQSKWEMKKKLRKKQKTDRGTELRTASTENVTGSAAEDGSDDVESIKSRVHRFLSHTAFDTAIGAVIVLNSLVIGLESQSEIYGHDTTTYQRLEHFFLFIYTVELALRFYSYGSACLRNSWVKFDFILVSLGLFSTYVIEPFLYYSGLGATSDEDYVGMLLVLRIFRLAKITRTVRLLSQFRALWMLVCGLLSSAGTMIYILVLRSRLLFFLELALTKAPDEVCLRKEV